MKLARSISTLIGILMRLGFGLATMAVIFWWMFALHTAAGHAPLFSALKELKLTIPQGSEVVLGRAELLQPAGARSAELQHVRLRATEDGQILISRVAELRDLNVEFGGKTEEGSSERYEISRRKGAVTLVSAGAQFVRISVRDDDALEFSIEDWTGNATTALIHRDGAELLINGEPADECYDQGLTGWVASKANRLSGEVSDRLAAYLGPFGLADLLQRKGKPTVAVLGGDLTCTMHSHALVAMPRANPELEFAIRRNLSDGRLFVSIYREAQLVPVSFETWLDGERIGQHYGRTGIEVPLAATSPLAYPPVTHFTAGKTRYSIDADSNTEGGWDVHIQPDRRIALFDDSVCAQPLEADTETASVEDCPPPLDSSPNSLPEGARIEVIKHQLPSTLDRLFVGSPDGLVSAEILARSSAIGLSLLIVLAVPGATIWRANGSVFRAALLTLAGCVVLGLALLPDLVAIGRQLTAIPDASRYMFYGLGASWVCATIVVMLDRSGGASLTALWFLLTAIIALSSISMFSLSAEGPNTDWERFFIKHKLVVLDVLPVFVMALTIVSPTALKLRIGNDFAGRPSLVSPTLWLLAIVFTLFAAWFFLGNQTGLGGSIQPVEAGKFAIVVLLGASLAQWLIRARLLAQAWFGITLIAVILSTLFLIALLFVPAVKSDYSPLIIIGSATAITGIVGFMAIGWRIREEEYDDLRDIKRIPLSYVPSIQDIRLSVAQFCLLLLLFAAIILSPLVSLDLLIQGLELLQQSVAYSLAAVVGLIAVTIMLIRTLVIPRALFIGLLGLPLALLGTWALWRQEIFILALSVGGLVTMAFAVAWRNRVNWTLARVAIAAPLIALVMAVALRDVPAKAGLGVQDWSWFDKPDKQITELEKVLGEGRRLPVERLMSWADLRFGRDGKYTEPRQLVLRDMNFHVLRSRATLANAPCGLSDELKAAPFNIGYAVEWIGTGISKGLGISCPQEARQAETLRCTPSTLKGPVRPHCVPVVQSDFAATYIATRHGNAAATLLIALQACFIFFVIGLYLKLQSKRSRDPVETGADQALACIALGSGMLFLMQWILAWSNAFGLLPVMGQPMTWLSAGTSHHLFMAIPAALVLLVATRLAGMKAPVLTIRVPPRRRG
ncbi:FtsW/RodA/SpoVE family cell cycle protein [Hoeflea sp. YIM 152468]|uniref:FtsW/RodA/SpoVE family cell cycle protein n=1 Tax=Hoeflea sp. YIM 152468 TaxID=3031759 RepID=UPI0023DA6C63|nr:FtsW/RodA/SpoVE family cell cycle protein [Hoeflea sp. YIM 152468]MDF1610329.1 FtsW/RodA/SpoVE family cell cycle protein [Hoeflea sp. YIM 152468]